MLLMTYILPFQEAVFVTHFAQSRQARVTRAIMCMQSSFQSRGGEGVVEAQLEEDILRRDDCRSQRRSEKPQLPYPHV
jgi:hypothetical protein